MDAELEGWKDKGQWFDYLGFEVFYVTEGSGPRLLLIHGYPFSSFDWGRVWPGLTQRFALIAPDMLGMGFSAKPVRYEYSVHDHADMHEALLEHLGVRECHLLAHDIGDSVAQELLARHEFAEQSGARFEIKSITWLNGGLFNEAYSPRPIQKLLSTTPLGEVFARYRGVLLTDAVLDRAVGEMFGPRTKPSPQLLEQFHQIMRYKDGRRVTHRVGRFVLDRYRHRNRWVRAMRQTRVPMRLIDGPCDPNSGRQMADRYLELIPDPDVVLLEDQIGHWPQIENPDAVLAHFLEFIDRLEGAPRLGRTTAAGGEPGDPAR
jgi:pimeloyl-ACP methyl ester carboxylesterase